MSLTIALIILSTLTGSQPRSAESPSNSVVSPSTSTRGIIGRRLVLLDQDSDTSSASSGEAGRIGSSMAGAGPTGGSGRVGKGAHAASGAAGNSENPNGSERSDSDRSDTPTYTPRVWPMRGTGFQNGTPDAVSLLDGRPTAAWFISGAFLGASIDTSLEEFLACSESRIRSLMEDYLERHPELHRSTTGQVILDIEHPASPVSLGSVVHATDPSERSGQVASIARAFALRTRVARSLLPNAKLLLYGVGTPQAQGRDTPNHVLNRSLAIEAAGAGLLDGVDGVCPVLYPRFAETEPGYLRRRDSVVQALIDVNRIIDAASGNVRPEVIPLLSFTIFNGASAAHEQPASLSDLQDRLGWVHDHGVSKVIFWNDGPFLRNTTVSVSDVIWKLDIEESRLLTTAVADGLD